MKLPTPSNTEIASLLDEIAALLNAQGSGPFRILAYRKAAQVIRERKEPVAALARDRLALEALPAVGKSIGRTIAEFVKTGRTGILNRMRGETSPEDLFTRIPGIGEVLASQIHRELHVETLEELECAVRDGRLARLDGIGDRRIQAITNGLRALLDPHGIPEVDAPPARSSKPSIEALLEIDALYRRKAEAGELQMITPKRFNPKKEAWLPIMHASRGDWHFTALFSNTERAHNLGKTHDWVIIFSELGGLETQATVVTESQGQLRGMRVVRGREEDCLAHYAPGKSAIAAHVPPKTEMQIS